MLANFDCNCLWGYSKAPKAWGEFVGQFKMDACNAVDKELDKLLGRFNVFQDSLEKLDELINHVKATKNGIDEGMWDLFVIFLLDLFPVRCRIWQSVH